MSKIRIVIEYEEIGEDDTEQVTASSVVEPTPSDPSPPDVLFAVYKDDVSMRPSTNSKASSYDGRELEVVNGNDRIHR